MSDEKTFEDALEGAQAYDHELTPEEVKEIYARGPRKELTDEDRRTLADALMILHQQFGGKKWTIEVGPIAAYDPDDFRPFRQLIVNGAIVEKIPTEPT